MSGEQKDEFFKPVGEIVEETNQAPSNIQQDPENPNVLYYTEPKEGESPVTTIESLCMQCQNPHGKTNLLMTTIPHFKKIIIMSFECDKCGFKNNEIQTGNDLEVKGVDFTLDIRQLLNNENWVKDLADFMNRQIVKSAYGVVSFKFIPSNTEDEIVQFEIPKGKAQLSTTEGLMMDTILDLHALQHLRKYQNIEAYEKIDDLIHCVYAIISKNNNGKLEEIVDGQEQKLHESIDFNEEKVAKYADSITEIKVNIKDPSGNSFMEYKPFEEGSNINYSKKEYFRSDEDNLHLGLITEDQLAEKKVLNQVVDKYLPTFDEKKEKNAADEKMVDEFVNDIETFVASCPSCLSEGCITNMKPLNIPHFKQVLIMSTKCDSCGYKSNEVKTGGGISQYGKKTILTITAETIEEDLKRDLLKSETCKLFIPQIHLDIQEGTLGGRFTTLEGILKQVHDELYERVFQESYDSMEESTKQNWLNFFKNLTDVMSCKLPEGCDKLEVMLIDPLANSYLQNIYAPDEDPMIEYQSFKRSRRENEDLGILDLLKQEGLSEGEEDERDVDEE